MTGRPIAFFDVDKTLCRGYSGYYTTVELIRRGIVKKRHLAKAVLYRAIGRAFKQMNVRRMYEIAFADLAGTRLEEIMQIGLEVFEKKIKPRLYREGIREIEKLRSEGFIIVLISSGPTMSIRNMERFLKADTSFSNGPQIRDGILQKQIQEPLCYKEGKVTVAQQYAESHLTPLSDCRFYADSYSDLPLLGMVGHPRVVNPDNHLRKEAVKRGWPILHFHQTMDHRP